MLKGKKIIIVGGSSGIGLKLTEKLSSKNCELIIASRKLEKLKYVESLFKEKVTCYQLDASNEKDVNDFFTDIGQFDHLISTIKPEHLVSSFIESKSFEVRKAFESKFWGQYYLVQHGLKNINDNGSFILTSGIASRRSYSGFSGTAAINGAVESLVKSLSGEIAPIRINSVCPGFIERFPDDNERFKSINKLGARIPLKRLGCQDEVADAYIYLLESKYSTGVILEIDGGELSV